QKHLTVSAATQANARDLAKWHVDHAAHSQPVLVRLTASHGSGFLRTSRRMYNHCWMISRVLCQFISKKLARLLPKLARVREGPGQYGVCMSRKWIAVSHS